MSCPKIDEKWILTTMKNLDISREDAIEMWMDDHDIDAGKAKDFDLDAERQKVAKDMLKGAKKEKAPPNYSMENAAKKRAPRKPNDEKRMIIGWFKTLLEGFALNNQASKVELVNIEREITFQVGENDYSIVLTCHRKPKK